MPNRIIINNRSELSEMAVMILVHSVMQGGRISNNNKQYCYLTSFIKTDGEYHVVTDLRKKSDSFTVYKVPNDK
jgi:hypothetical protein